MISAVLPALNEQENLELAVDRAVEALAGMTDEFEVIIVDDGSTDGTLDVARELMRKHGALVRVVVHPVNRGYGAALRSGFSVTRGDLVFYTDADNQFDIAELAYFLPLIEDYDVAVGFRVYRYDTAVRSVLSWVYNRIVSVLFRVRVRDVDCAFKLFRREVLEKIQIECDDFFVDAELVAKARKWNFRILEKGVRHYPRLAGETTVQASHITRTLREIALMWRRIYMPSQKHLRELAERRSADDFIELEPTGSLPTS